MNAQPTASERIARLLVLIPWVASHPGGVAVDEVCTRFDIDAAELAREIDIVMMVGVHPFTPDTMIEAWIDEGRVKIEFAEAFPRPLRLTADEAVSLITAAAGLTTLTSGPQVGPLKRAVDKIAAVAGIDDSRAVAVDLGAAPQGIIELLEGARHDRVQVEIDYPGTAGVRARRIEPARLFSSAGRWYVSGWCHAADDYRIFRVDRILAVRPTTEPFVHDSPVAPEKLGFAESFPHVVLEVDRAWAWVLDAVPAIGWEETEQGVRVELAIASPEWLARLLIQLGPAVRMVTADPALDIGTETAREAERILEAYR